MLQRRSAPVLHFGSGRNNNVQQIKYKSNMFSIWYKLWGDVSDCFYSLGVFLHHWLVHKLMKVVTDFSPYVLDVLAHPIGSVFSKASCRKEPVSKIFILYFFINVPSLFLHHPPVTRTPQKHIFVKNKNKFCFSFWKVAKLSVTNEPTQNSLL